MEKTLSVKNLGAGTALIEEVMTDRHRFTPGFWRRTRMMTAAIGSARSTSSAH